MEPISCNFDECHLYNICRIKNSPESCALNRALKNDEDQVLLSLELLKHWDVEELFKSLEEKHLCNQ